LGGATASLTGGGQEHVDLSHRLRMMEQEALSGLAAEQGQLRLLLNGFDALGDGLEVQRVGDLDNRAAQRPVLLGPRQRTDEAAVKLEDVDRESLQIAERGIPGSEVVNSDSPASSTSPLSTVS